MGVTLRFNPDNLDSELQSLGLITGILERDGSGDLGVNGDWFNTPISNSGSGPTLANLFANGQGERVEELLTLLTSLFGERNPALLGVDGASSGERWIPIPLEGGDPSGIYLIAESSDDGFFLGIGLAKDVQEDNVRIRPRIALPILFTDGTSSGTQSPFAGDDFPRPLTVSLEISRDDGFGSSEVNFDGLRLKVCIPFDGEKPTVDAELIGLDVGMLDPMDLSLLSLAEDAQGRLIKIALALIQAKLEESESVEALQLLEHLLPIFGLGGDSRIPRLHWEDVLDDGTDLFIEWLRALVTDPAAVRAWLEHWQALLGDPDEGLELNLPEVEGSGTRQDPWRVYLPLSEDGDEKLRLYITLATEVKEDGTRCIYPGFLLSGLPFELVAAEDGDDSDIDGQLSVTLELFEMSLTETPEVDPLPRFELAFTLMDSDGDKLLLDYDFAESDEDDLHALGHFSIEAARAGIRLDEGAVEPFLEFINVSRNEDSWPLVDLTDLDKTIDVLEDMAANAIVDLLEDVLRINEPNSAGRHLAALLGFLPPTDPQAPNSEENPWPVELTDSFGELERFISDPLHAIGCYHYRCLKTQIEEAPAWRFLLYDISALLQMSVGASLELEGSGSTTDPWRIVVFDEDEGRMAIRAWAVVEEEAVTLVLGTRLESNPLDLNEDMRLRGRLDVDLLRVDMLEEGADEGDAEGEGDEGDAEGADEGDAEGEGDEGDSDDLPEEGEDEACAGEADADWLPGAALSLWLEGQPPEGDPDGALEPFELSTGLGFRVSATSVMLEGLWTRSDGFDYDAAAENLDVEWEGFDTSLTLPRFRLGGSGGLSLNWDLASPNFGLDFDCFDLDLPDIDFPDISWKLGQLFRFSLGRWAIDWGGPWGFFFSGLFGWVPDWPNFNIKLPRFGGDFDFNLPDGLALDWPDFKAPNCPDFFSDPWSGLSLHLGRLFCWPDFGKFALGWFSWAFQAKLPNFNLPDLGWDWDFGSSSSDSNSFNLPELDVEAGGDGTFENPWWVTLEATRRWHLNLWLDPSGPPDVGSFEDLENIPGSVSHVGYGLSYVPAMIEEGGITIQPSFRLDIRREALQDDASDDGLPPLPLFTAMAEVRRESGKLIDEEVSVGGGAPQPLELDWIELGLKVNGRGLTPILRLHGARAPGMAELIDTIELEDLGDLGFSSSMIFDLLMDAFLERFTLPNVEVPAKLECLCKLLEDYRLLEKTGSGNNERYAISVTSWVAFLADPTLYMKNESLAILVDSSRREDLAADIRSCMEGEGLELPWPELQQLLLGALSDLEEELGEEWRCLREILVALELLLPASHGYVINPTAWLLLIQDPLEFLRSRVGLLLADEDRRSELLNALRELLDLDPAGTVSWESELGQVFRLEVTAEGAISLCFGQEPVSSGAASDGETGDGDEPVVELGEADRTLRIGELLTFWGCVRIDLRERTTELDLFLKPEDLSAILIGTYGFELNEELELVEDEWTLSLLFADSLEDISVTPIRLHPWDEESLAQLSSLVPELIVSNFLYPALEQGLRSELGTRLAPVLEQLGLVCQPFDDGLYRVRGLIAFFEDPVAFLLSEAALGNSEGRLDPAKLISLLNKIAELLDIKAPDTPIEVTLEPDVPGSGDLTIRASLKEGQELDLGGAGNLDFDLSAIIRDGDVDGAGLVTCRFTLPDIPDAGDYWDEAILQFGYENEGFVLRLGGKFGEDLGGKEVLVDLIPFEGWAALLEELAASVSVGNLLDTVSKSLINALQLRKSGSSGDAADKLGTLLDVLEALELVTIDGFDISFDGLESLANDPVAWLQTRFSSANAGTSAGALEDLLELAYGEGSEEVERDGGALRFSPIPELSFEFGRKEDRIGVWVYLNDLSLGPIRINPPASDTDGDSSNDGEGEALASVTIGGEPDPDAEVDATLELALAPDILELGDVSIEPRILGSTVGDDPFTLKLYPLGRLEATSNFALSILPNVALVCEESGDTDVPDFIGDLGGMAPCVVDLVRGIILPMIGNLVLEESAVHDWLQDTELFGGVSAGDGLEALQLVEYDSGEGRYRFGDFLELDSATDYLTSCLQTIASAITDDGGSPIIPFADEDPARPGDQPGLYFATREKDGAGTLYGIRIVLSDIQLASDPEIWIEMGDEADWIEDAGGTGGLKGGMAFYLVADDPSWRLYPELDLVSVGLDLNGKGDDPLINESGFRLEGIQGRFYLALPFTDIDTLEWGVWSNLQEMGIPLGAASGDASNPVAQNILSAPAESSSEDGESSSINPEFSVSIGYVTKLNVSLGADVIWFPIQRQLGPITVSQIGVRWDDGPKRLGILMDGGVNLSGLAIGVDDLEIGIPITRPFEWDHWRLDLKGLAVAYNEGGVRISGGLLRDDQDGLVQYLGMVLVEVAGRTFTAMGAYCQLPGGDPSMFVFVLLPITIGGPPYFFIEGLAGGFGYNRGLNIPPIEEVQDFPLVSAPMPNSGFTDDPMYALQRLADDVPARSGAVWLAAGLLFSSFKLIDSFGMLYILFDRGFEIGLLGLSQMDIPKGAPLVRIQMALKARFSTREGLLSVEARLTDNSWILNESCRLTGGFAFYLWFAGEHAGDFVVSIGGYHPKFQIPDHYPAVDRLGFEWRVSSAVTIKGGSYFTLTNSCVMAGGSLEAVFRAGSWLKAWFEVWFDMLISWNPFYYDFGVGISLGVELRVTIDLWFTSFTITLRLELGGSLEIWGPPFTGLATVDVAVVSFTVPFGASADDDGPDPISWNEFCSQVLPPHDPNANEPSYNFFGKVESGLLETVSDVVDGKPVDRWVLKPEFVLGSETVIPFNSVEILVGSRDFATVGIRNAEGKSIYDDSKALTELGKSSSSWIEPGDFDLDIRPMGESDITSTHSFVIEPTGGQSVDRSAITTELVYGRVPAANWDFDGNLRAKKADARTIVGLVGTRFIADIDEDSLDATDTIDVMKIVEEGEIGRWLPYLSAPDARYDEDLVGLIEQARALDLGLLQDSDSIFVVAAAILSGSLSATQQAASAELLATFALELPAATSIPVTRTRLKRRRQSPPLITTLAEGLDSTPSSGKDTDLGSGKEDGSFSSKSRWPELKAVIRQQLEPTRNGATNIRTTITKAKISKNIAEISADSLCKSGSKQASLRKVAPAAGLCPTKLSQGSKVFVNSKASTSKAKAEFKSLTDRALRGSSARSDAVVLNSGASMVWDIPTRGAKGKMPMIDFQGDQVLRMTSFDRSGRLLEDLEIPAKSKSKSKSKGKSKGRTSASIRKRLPEGAARLVVSGFGVSAGKESSKPAMGAISLHEATLRVAAVGWHMGSRLIQVGPRALLARGAVVELKGNMSTGMKGQGKEFGVLDSARVALRSGAFTTHMPTAIETLGILINTDGSESAKQLQKAAPKFDLSGAKIKGSPRVVKASSGVALLLYDVECAQKGTSFKVSMAAGQRKNLAGIFGMLGSARELAKELEDSSLFTLVENGPLTPRGQSKYAFKVA